MSDFEEHGERPTCADLTYENELVDRAAPRWAWDIIDETLARITESEVFMPGFRADNRAANLAMIRACETDDGPISRPEIEAKTGSLT